jgi:arsenate reductase (thioredoxin)
VVPDDHLTGNRGKRHRLRGPSRIDPAAPHPAPAPTRTPSAPQEAAIGRATPAHGAATTRHPTPVKKRVLFICIGNSCRSQMAEAFARAYGGDVMEVQSAGVSPATMIAPQTKQTLAERNLNIDDQFPKGMDIIRRQPFDLVVNMSGIPVTLPGAHMVEWKVPDPIGQKEYVYRAVADQLEGLVIRLILELRKTP